MEKIRKVAKTARSTLPSGVVVRPLPSVTAGTSNRKASQAAAREGCIHTKQERVGGEIKTCLPGLVVFRVVERGPDSFLRLGERA